MASFVHYDDDGTTQEYLSGRSTRTQVSTSVKGDKLTVTINPTSGSFEGFEPQQQTELRVNVSSQPKKVTAKVGGKSVALRPAASLAEFEQGENVYFYNARPNLNRFSTPGTPFAKKEIIKNPQLLVKLGRCNVVENLVEVTVQGFAYAPADRLLQHS